MYAGFAANVYSDRKEIEIGISVHDGDYSVG